MVTDYHSGTGNETNQGAQAGQTYLSQTFTCFFLYLSNCN